MHIVHQVAEDVLHCPQQGFQQSINLVSLRIEVSETHAANLI